VGFILSASQTYELATLATSHFIGLYVSLNSPPPYTTVHTPFSIVHLGWLFFVHIDMAFFFPMLVGDNGNVEVQERLLNTKFYFKLGSIYIEEEVFSNSSEMVETILQLKFKNNKDVVWYSVVEPIESSD
jgi:hypothetical protein